ncbi:MAG: hypothetical protein E7316_01530 [Clostridiales bacterium]|nr:hypothetical protein [Clostridiales bacterium]
MKKRMLLALMLVLCVVALCACQSSGTKYTVVEKTTNQPPVQATQNLNLTGDQPTANIIDFDNGGYDPTAEEGLGEEWDDFVEETPAPATAAPTVRSEYAGATPVLLDPIDKPTPTPAPPISFTYQAYDAINLHLTFEAPVGWSVDESVADTYILRNPDPSMAYQASLTVTATSVSSQMNKSSLNNQVEAMLDAIADGENVKSFSPSRTAERTLLDQTGVYANYTGVLDNGEEIAGRVHATCVNKVLYTVHVTYPRAYRDTYEDTVYATLRKTINVTQ